MPLSVRHPIIMKNGTAAAAAASVASPKSEEEQRELNEALCKAAREGCEVDVERCLAEGAEVDYRQEDIFGFTPLIHAARENQKGVVKLLVAKGAPVSARCSSGWAPAHWAASYGCLEALKELIACGADVTKRTSEGWTALAVAQQKRKLEVVAFLEAC